MSLNNLRHKFSQPIKHEILTPLETQNSKLKTDYASIRLILYFAFWWACVVPAFAQRPAEKPDQAGALLAAGDAYLQKRDYVNALEQYELAKPLLQQVNDENRLGLLLKKIGDVYAARNYYRQSVDYYREAVTYLRKTGQQALLGACLESMAGITASFGYSTQAINHYTKNHTPTTETDPQISDH